jgi:hypothetical protein
MEAFFLQKIKIDIFKLTKNSEQKSYRRIMMNSTKCANLNLKFSVVYTKMTNFQILIFSKLCTIYSHRTTHLSFFAKPKIQRILD